MLSLIRGPLDLALSVAESVLQTSLAAVRTVRGMVEEDIADTRWAVADPFAAAPRAEPGAEDGAGAELHVEEPWEGYAREDSGAIVRMLENAGRETLAAVELYEATHRKRRMVLEAAERRLKQLSGPAATRNR